MSDRDIISDKFDEYVADAAGGLVSSCDYESFEAGWQAARQAPASGEVEPLEWSPIMEPVEGCRYNHVYSETLFGRFLITWKGWKDGGDPFCIDETPWGSFDEALPTLDLAKEHCEREFLKRLLSYTHPSTSANQGGVLEGRVAIPRDVAEAKGMYLVGYSWLKYNAPHELTSPSKPEQEWVYREPDHGEEDYCGQVWTLDRCGHVELLSADDCVAEFMSGEETEIIAFQPTGLKRPQPPKEDSGDE